MNADVLMSTKHWFDTGIIIVCRCLPIIFGDLVLGFSIKENKDKSDDAQVSYPLVVD